MKLVNTNPYLVWNTVIIVSKSDKDKLFDSTSNVDLVPKEIKSRTLFTIGVMMPLIVYPFSFIHSFMNETELKVRVFNQSKFIMDTDIHLK